MLETDNPSIIESAKKLFKKDSKVDYWKSLTKDQKEDIEKGIAEIENGEFIEYTSLMKKHRR